MKVVIKKGITKKEISFSNEANNEARLLGWKDIKTFLDSYARKFYNCYSVFDDRHNLLAIFGIRENNGKAFYFSTKALMQKELNYKVAFFKKMKKFIDDVLLEDYKYIEVEIPKEAIYERFLKDLGFNISYKNDFIEIGYKTYKKNRKIDSLLNKAF